ncbi:TPA: conjugal transfer protein [Pasteurella multocida]|nr:conjugal transfer protein [Pasteurella multocida]
MNKRKTVFRLVVTVIGIVAMIDRIRLHNKLIDLEERGRDISRCHHDFCIMQGKYNRSIEEEITGLQEEIGSVYEHMEKLSKIFEKGR